MRTGRRDAQPLSAALRDTTDPSFQDRRRTCSVSTPQSSQSVQLSSTTISINHGRVNLFCQFCARLFLQDQESALSMRSNRYRLMDSMVVVSLMCSTLPRHRMATRLLDSLTGSSIRNSMGSPTVTLNANTLTTASVALTLVVSHRAFTRSLLMLRSSQGSRRLKPIPVRALRRILLNCNCKKSGQAMRQSAVRY